MVEMSQLQGLPSFIIDTSSRGYKFYPTKESFNSGLGYNIRKLCGYDVSYTFLQSSFLEENNLSTVQDTLDLLNSWGYNETLYGSLRYHGYRFDKGNWTWSHISKSGNEPIVGTELYPSPSSSSSFLYTNGLEKYFYTDLSYTIDNNEPLWKVWYKIKQDLPNLDIPAFMLEQNSHKFTPEFQIMRDNDMSNMTFGIEIEVSTKLSKWDLQYLITQVEPIQEPFFYFKHDGSINSSYGFEHTYEIVTMPCTFKFLRKNFKILFDKLDAKLPDWPKYFKIDKSCGVHVHVNKDSFFSNLHLKKFVSIWNQYDSLNTTFIQKVGMRKFNKYCNIHQDQDGRTIARRLKVGAWGPGHDNKRYASCRETYHTAEVRIFKGGFDYDHIMYCLEAVHAMHQFSNKTPISLISTRRFIPEFTTWLNDEVKYSRLKEHLKCA